MSRARMAELVDAPASGAGAGNGVEVRVLFRAPFFGTAMIVHARESGCRKKRFYQMNIAEQ